MKSMIVILQLTAKKLRRLRSKRLIESALYLNKHQSDIENLNHCFTCSISLIESDLVLLRNKLILSTTYTLL